MGVALRPIDMDEYEKFYQELYASDSRGLKLSRFRVPMDADPTLNPKGINEKLSTVQGHKDRAVVIYNRAIQNKNYWDAIIKKLDSKFESEYQRAMLSENVRKAGNAESRVASATEVAKQRVYLKAFIRKEEKDVRGDLNDEDWDKLKRTYSPLYDGRRDEIVSRLSEATSFLNEVKNLYDNLDGTSMTLAVQLKSVMVNARIYGQVGVEGNEKDDGRF